MPFVHLKRFPPRLFNNFTSGRSKHLLLPLLLILLILSITVHMTRQQQEERTHAGGGLPGLHVQGNKIGTDTGQQVILRGVNKAGTDAKCVTANAIFEGPGDAASIQAIKSWKANVLRVPLNEDCWLGINGANPGGATYQQAIINYVNLVNQNGLYVILDLHWNAPGTIKATGPQVMADRDHSPAFWRSIAQAFKGNNAVIFDLYNEPHDISWQCWKNGETCSGVSYQVAGMQELVNAVRSTGATNIVMIAGVKWANDLTGWIANKPTDPINNIAVSWHSYGPLGSNSYNIPSWWDQTVAPVLTQYPLITGEFGESGNSSVCGTTFISTLLSWLDSHHASGYLAWMWNVWGQFCSALSLISSYDGTPKYPNGTYYKNYLHSIVVTPILLPTNTSSPPQTSTIQPIWRIDAGSTMNYTDTSGNVWMADTGLSGGKTVDRGNISIANTTDPRIYQTEHYGMTSASYTVPNGNYIVNLDFAETYSGITGLGQRVFSVDAQSIRVISNLDVFAQAGGRNIALVKSFPVSVTNGTLTLTFIKQIQAPEINGIEIIPQ